MAHFAKLDQSNIVEQVIVVHNNELLDENGNESEQKGIDFCQSLFGADTKWAQTSYNGNIRKNYAGIGSYFDEARDAFIYPKPFDSWVLDEQTCRWEAPVEHPEDDGIYTWNESTLAWDLVE